MAEKGKGKRPLLEDSLDLDLDPPPSPRQEKKPRFPKGRKVKQGDYVFGKGGDGDDLGAGFGPAVNPMDAAKERKMRRNRIKQEEALREQADISSAEVHYEDSANFEDDGIQIEPFNLNQEREEGYFDANGNYVEYASKIEIKDAWLDNAIVDSSFAGKKYLETITDDEYQDLSSEELEAIKRRIASVLDPGETILQALKRLKATAGDKRGKMSEGTKRIFDQLTEDAMKLMEEEGDNDVYHKEREYFEGKSGETAEFDVTTDVNPKERERESFEGKAGETADGDDQFDMFGDDYDINTENLPLNESTVDSGPFSEQIPRPGLENLASSSDSGEAASGVESDFVFDESSGYYYSSKVGYYYDPVSTLYCCATSGKWYSFDESTGEYVEYINEAPVSADAAGN